MKRKNAYLEKQEEFRKASMEAMQRTTEQYFIDCAAIALNRKGWGEKRVREFLIELAKVHDEFYDALKNIPETDYYRQKLDENLMPLCKLVPLVPFEERYEYLPEMRY